MVYFTNAKVDLLPCSRRIYPSKCSISSAFVAVVVVIVVAVFCRITFF